MIEEKTLYRKEYENIFESRKVDDQKEDDVNEPGEEKKQSSRRKKGRKRKVLLDNPDQAKINKRNEELIKLQNEVTCELVTSIRFTI